MRRRGRLLNWHAIARAAFFLTTAAAIASAAVHLGYRTFPSLPRLNLPDRFGPVPTNPLVFTLTHCQAIGAAAEESPFCKAAWAENRRRFFSNSIQLPALAVPHLSVGSITTAPGSER
jgi:conjugative transfer region protein TrbK